jgi:hypothetical protein
MSWLPVMPCLCIRHLAPLSLPRTEWEEALYFVGSSNLKHSSQKLAWLYSRTLASVGEFDPQIFKDTTIYVCLREKKNVLQARAMANPQVGHTHLADVQEGCRVLAKVC